MRNIRIVRLHSFQNKIITREVLLTVVCKICYHEDRVSKIHALQVHWVHHPLPFQSVNQFIYEQHLPTDIQCHTRLEWMVQNMRLFLHVSHLTPTSHKSKRRERLLKMLIHQNNDIKNKRAKKVNQLLFWTPKDMGLVLNAVAQQILYVHDLIPQMWTKLLLYLSYLPFQHSQNRRYKRTWKISFQL